MDNILNDLKGSSINYVINILDNDSEDNLSYLEEKYAKFAVKFYFSDKNLGFGGGHNLLAKKASAQYLLLVNPDIEL